MCYPGYNNLVTYVQLHETLKRATPTSIIKYNHALLLYKVYNSVIPNSDWIEIHFNQNFNDRLNNVNFHDTSNNKQGKKPSVQQICDNQQQNSLLLAKHALQVFQSKIKALISYMNQFIK